MEPIFTLFEQLNGKHTLETLTPIVVKQYKLEEEYKTQIFPSIANRLACTFLTTTLFAVYCQSNSLSSTLVYFIPLVTSVILCNISFKTLIQSKWGNKILSISKKFRQQKQDYDSSCYHFKNNLRNTSFQVAIFDTLQNLNLQLKEINDASYIDNLYKRNYKISIEKLCLNLEKMFSQENYDGAFINIQESMTWLPEVFSLMDQTQKISLYRNKISNFKEQVEQHDLIVKEIELEAAKPKYNLRAML